MSSLTTDIVVESKTELLCDELHGVYAYEHAKIGLYRVFMCKVVFIATTISCTCKYIQEANKGWTTGDVNAKLPHLSVTGALSRACFELWIKSCVLLGPPGRTLH